MHPIVLAPSMMCVPQWEYLGESVKALEDANVGLLHMDVMDGEFVPNLMLGTENVRQMRRISKVPLDIHLMINRPEDKLHWFDIQPGEYVSIHVESTNHLQRVLSQVRSYGAHPMVALNPATPLSTIEEVLDDVDAVLLMTVNPGFAGQKLVPQALDKIARLRKMLDETGHSDVLIQVDGNVSFETAPKMRAAGADIFVCGTSSLFHKDGTIEENAKRFMAALEG